MTNRIQQWFAEPAEENAVFARMEASFVPMPMMLFVAPPMWSHVASIYQAARERVEREDFRPEAPRPRFSLN
jgi:hypothetical protein